MKIKIRDVTSKGLTLSEQVAPSDIGLMPEDLNCLSPLLITTRVERVDNTILAHTQVEGRYSFLCSRCLAPIDNERCQEFDFDYEIEKGMESIDLGEDIRQEMILACPPKVLCSTSCKGMCLKCGVNLNKEECKCKKK